MLAWRGRQEKLRIVLANRCHPKSKFCRAQDRSIGGRRIFSIFFPEVLLEENEVWDLRRKENRRVRTLWTVNSVNNGVHSLLLPRFLPHSSPPTPVEFFALVGFTSKELKKMGFSSLFLFYFYFCLFQTFDRANMEGKGMAISMISSDKKKLGGKRRLKVKQTLFNFI